MVNKVRVFGKAQNRTALGIVNAYLVMNPKATFEDFVNAFPKSLNTDNGWPVIFKRAEEIDSDNARDFFFTAEDEVITLNDGTKMTLCKMWTKTSFEKLVEHVGQFGIEIAEFEKAMKGERGGFRLEYLNGYIPPKIEAEPVIVPAPEPKKSKAWIWIVIVILLLIAAALTWFLTRDKEPESVVETVETVVVVHDTIYTEKIAELETNFNAAQFEKRKADLNDDAKFVLHDLAQVLEKNPDIKLKIEGHTSADGDATFNQKLSEARAKAAVDFLVSQGIDESRLSYEGLGSSKLKNTDDPNSEENRRTEFIVIQ